MKKLLNIALCLAVALVVASCGKTEIKVISYNVRVDVSEDGENCWENYQNDGNEFLENI